MKRLIVGISLVLTACYSLAETPADQQVKELTEKIESMLKEAPKGPHGGKIVSPELKALMDQRSGGLVTPKTNGKTIMIVDAREADDDFLKSYAVSLGKSFHIGVTPVVKKIPADADLYDAAVSCKTATNPAVILVVNREKKPVLSVYPEDAVGIVNANSLKDADKSKYTERLSKEIWRCIGLSLGGYSMAAPNGRIVKSVLSPVYSLKDLDEMKMTSLSPNQCNAVYDAMSEIQLQAARPTPYMTACRQGWAPAPTNAIQKAIWEKVRSDKERGPSNGLKIVP